MSLLTVGISDFKIAMPPEKIVTYALGSCVGICILDKKTHLGGLLHIMLPTMSSAPGDSNAAKFADTGIPHMVRLMEAKGASRANLVAKIAGGAQMFQIVGNNPMGKIGERNVEATKAALQQLRIPIIAEDTGANYGRTVIFDPATGSLEVRALNKQLKML